MRSLVLTLDLDGPQEYAALYGRMREMCAADPLVMYGAPLRRFEELCAAARASGTLFVIGRDLHGAALPALERAIAAGFEIANHSHNHDYHLSRRSPADIAEELTRSQAAFGDTLQLQPRGFRAPGYQTSGRLLDQLEATGFDYSSSLMPSPPYYAAKAMVIAGYRLRGVRSASMLGAPGPWLGPRQPYRPGTLPFARGSRALIELPVAVATPLRLPVTGASLVLAPTWLRKRMLRSMQRERHLVINMHAMDLVDTENDPLPSALLAKQPELRVPLVTRLATLTDFFVELSDGRTTTTCAALVESLAAGL